MSTVVSGVPDEYIELGLAGNSHHSTIKYCMSEEDVVEGKNKNRERNNPDFKSWVQVLRAMHEKVIAIKIFKPAGDAPTDDSFKTHSVCQEPFALKKISEKNQEDGRKDFRRHFPRLRDEGKWKDQDWYAMDSFTRGATIQSLLDHVDVGTLPESLICRFSHQIVNAYNFLHQSCNIVQRDVSLDNIMLRYNAPGLTPEIGHEPHHGFHPHYINEPDIAIVDFGRWFGLDKHGDPVSEHLILEEQHAIINLLKRLALTGWDCNSPHTRQCIHTAKNGTQGKKSTQQRGLETA